MASPREQILATVREIVAPLVRADGGDIYLVNAGERSLTLHLSGRFSGCPGNTLARRRVIEPLLTAPASDLTPALLRINPSFKPLMGNPRFQRLLR